MLSLPTKVNCHVWQLGNSRAIAASNVSAPFRASRRPTNRMFTRSGRTNGFGLRDLEMPNGTNPIRSRRKRESVLVLDLLQARGSTREERGSER